MHPAKAVKLSDKLSIHAVNALMLSLSAIAAGLPCGIVAFPNAPMGVAGLVFFVVNLIFAGWIKFSPNKAAPACVTVILATALVYLSVTHGRWVKHIFGRAHLSKVSIFS